MAKFLSTPEAAAYCTPVNVALQAQRLVTLNDQEDRTDFLTTCQYYLVGSPFVAWLDEALEARPHQSRVSKCQFAQLLMSFIGQDFQPKVLQRKEDFMA